MKGQRTDLRPERLNLRHERPGLRPEKPDLRPERDGGCLKGLIRFLKVRFQALRDTFQVWDSRFQA